MSTSPVRSLLTALAAGVWLTGVAFAQDAPVPLVVAPTADATTGIKHHVSFGLSGGFDLDVFGDILMGGLGERNGQQLAVRQARPWPDIYVAVPKSAQVSVGFGVFRRDEVIARLSRATYTSEPVTDAGNFAGQTGSEALIASLSSYREQSWELGWRRYLAMTKRYKQYAQFLYGIRTVEPISATFSVDGPEGTLGTLRLYDRSKLKAMALEVGLTLEFGHVGVFTEVGAHWQGKLKGNDDDLATWSLQPINNTGARFYMPLQFGLLFRL